MNTHAPTPRAGELTGILRRDRFEEAPALVTAPRDLARWAAFREAYHRAQQLDGPEDWPLQVDFELNSTCQMKCVHCTHGQVVVRKNELAWGDFTRVIDEGERYGLCSVKLNYINEPLLRRDLEDFVRYARGHGVLNVYFATNGLLLTRERARSLIDAGVSKIMVSLDATTPGTFSLMRRSAKLAEVEDNIHGLLDLRRALGLSFPLVRVNFLRTAENKHEADAFIQRWSGVADAIGFQRQVQLPGVDDDLFVDQSEDAPAIFRCTFPSKLLVVDNRGDILPCCTFSGREMPLGNIATMTLADAWRSSQMRQLKRLHVTGNGAQNPVCARCVGACHA